MRGGKLTWGPHTHQTGSFGLSAREGREKRRDYSLVGPTDVVTHEIGRLFDVASGEQLGMVMGGKRKGGNKLKCTDGFVTVWSCDF